MLLNDKEIIKLAAKGMITPYITTSVSQYNGFKALSYGVSSFGYDVRIAEEIQIFKASSTGVIDPKRPNRNNLKTLSVKTTSAGERYVILPPNSFVLGYTIEVFDVPRDVMIVAVGKSTLARAGLSISVTPIEPGFRGQVVIEITNTTPLNCMLYLNEGVAQFMFHTGNPCNTSYADRNGKYQDQRGIELGKC